MKPTIQKTAQDPLSRSLALAATVLLSLGMSFCLAQPANDMFANRILLTGTNVVATGSNVGATKEPGEPGHAGNTGGASVWWSWTAPSNCTVKITTAGSSFDTLLAIYIGSAVSALTSIAANDDAPNGQDTTSKVAYTGASNQTYQIAVDGYGADSGSAQLQIEVGPLLPPSDVVAWGNNQVGETDVPGGLSNVVAIAAGESHSLALTAEGRVVAWGWNDYGQTDVPGGLSNVVAIAAGMYHSLALKADGEVELWGDVSSGQDQGLWTASNVVAIAAGDYHGLGLTAAGRVVAWGTYQYDSQQWLLMRVPGGLSNVVAIAAGGDHCLALTAEGCVVAWGSSPFYYSGETNVPGGLSNVVAIASAGCHSLALTSHGRVVAWGSYQGTNVPSGLTNVVAIAAGGPYAYKFECHSLALTADGRVVRWGEAGFGQTNVTSALSNVVGIAAGGSFDLALLQRLTMPMPGLELTRESSRLEFRGHGAPGISCQLLRASSLTGPWLPTQPVTFTNTVQLLRSPDPTVAAQFFRLLRR